MTTPAITAVRMTGSAGRAELPLLVLGPSLGTSAMTLWERCAAELTPYFDILAWDLPGHGHNRSVPEDPFTIAELAVGALRVVDDVLAQRDELGGSFSYAGVSVGGAVGLQLLLDVPDRVSSAVLMCTGAKIGEAEMWAGRIEQVGASGTRVMVSGSAQRWFAPGFAERLPEVAAPLLEALHEVDDRAYIHLCSALADFDLRDRLDQIGAPVLAIAGAEDPVTPPADLKLVADGVRDGRLVELPGAAHLAPAEAPVEIARLIRDHVLGEEGTMDDRTMAEAREDGMAVRREVLGDEHVDRAIAGTTELTRDFQELITTYAWGSIWTRPGLDRRSRSLVTLTALVARGHHEELALHLRAARRNGLSVDEIKELLLQTAVYCGVPDANTAFRIAQEVFGEDAEDDR